HDAFYLVAIATVEALVPAPRSMDAIMVHGQVVTIALEIVDDELDPLGIRLRGHEHGILRGDHGQTFDSDQSNAGLIAIGKAIFGGLEDNFAFAAGDIS